MVWLKSKMGSNPVYASQGHIIIMIIIITTTVIIRLFVLFEMSYYIAVSLLTFYWLNLTFAAALFCFKCIVLVLLSEYGSAQVFVNWSYDTFRVELVRKAVSVVLPLSAVGKWAAVCSSAHADCHICLHQHVSLLVSYSCVYFTHGCVHSQRPSNVRTVLE